MDIRKFIVFFVAAVSFCSSAAAIPQNEGYDVFIPIAKYIRQGDADKLSAWFDSNLEISIISNTSDSSKNQGTQKRPRGRLIVFHKNAPMKPVQSFSLPY